MTAKHIRLFVILTAAMSVAGHAATKGKIVGKVTDMVTHEPLLSAIVVVEGTSLGNSSDLEGNFTITAVPAGSYRVRASYIGYKTVVDSGVTVTDENTTILNFALQPVTLETAPVVITAQASGQDQAINQQLSAPQIMNVVSSARIQELPDANAAESVGRLPGVSVLRDGGEASQVVVRGLEPKYNAITVNGVRMASSDSSDRSANLSMISPYSLEGIELIKVTTPDLDPDVLGGTVNFRLREAKGEEPGLRYNILGQNGYTGLSDATDKFRNYKYVGSVEGRFLEDHQLGLFGQADIERRNLTSNEFGGGYSQANNNAIDYYTSGLNLNDVVRDRQRFNGTLVMDYKLPDWKIGLSNFGSSGATDIQNRGENYAVSSGNAVHNYFIQYSKITSNVLTSALNLEHSFPLLHMVANLSHSFSETKKPEDWTIGFHQNDPGLASRYGSVLNLDPRVIPPAASNDTSTTYLSQIVVNSNYSREHALTAALDFDADLSLPELNTSAVVKFGGKFRHQTRMNIHDQSGGDGVALTSARFVDSLVSAHFPGSAQYAGSTSIPVAPFLDPSYSYGKFLDGDYPMILPLSYPMLSEMAKFVRANADLITQNDAISWAYDKFNSTTFNYSGYENQSAVYAMATVNIGEVVTLIPGVRFQDIYTSYEAPQGIENTNSLHGGVYTHYDTTVTVDHSYLLPDVLLKYKPLSWFDVRLAFTNTLSYPDYNVITPRIDVNTGGTIYWNNTQLAPTKSHNYDLYASFYDNTAGLLTVGGFWKKIEDLIYPLTMTVNDSAAKPYYPQEYVSGTSFSGSYTVNTNVNLSKAIDNYGLEIDWQTHFWYLPHPFDGMVLNLNYTHVFSTADYPYVIYIKPSPRSLPVPVDTTYRAPLLYQPNRILNLTLGYDYLGFSVRFSLLYQSDIFKGATSSPVWIQLYSSTAAYRRWDVSLKQDLPWYGMQLFGDINNLNSENDLNILHATTGVPSSQQNYGLSGDLGLRWRL